MELINNRYRIIKNLAQNKIFSTYLVLDMWDENKKMQLNVLNYEFLPSSLIDFYSSEFLNFININSSNIIKNYYFNRVSNIDNKEITEEQYYYTYEYIKKHIKLLEYIEDMDFLKIIDVFVEICKAVNYLHLKGFTYGELNLNNILVIKNNGNYKLKLKDLATVELEKNCYIDDNTDCSYFKSPIVLSSENPDKASDIYSLATILLTMLRKKQGNLNPKDDLAIFRKEVQDEYTLRVLDIIEKYITFDEFYPYDSINSIIEDLNNALNKSYTIICIEELEKLNLNTKIIGKEDEINSITKAYDSMVNYKPCNKIFLIQGNTGTGKTRFLEEIKFLLELKKANIYSSFSLSHSKDNNSKLWTEILRKLILEADVKTIEKYESELMKFFPEVVDRKNTAPIEYLNKDTTKYRLLNRIAGFINDSVKNKPAVFIIDNIHLANKFTIETFTYLYTEVINNKNIILIFSYNEGEIYNNQRFSKFIADIKKRNDSETINIKNLNKEQSAEMIKEIMSMFYTPIKLSNKIYSHTYGNPLFISEIIKELFNTKMIYVNEKSGWWYIDITNNDGYYNSLNIPNSIEQAVLNQIKDIDNDSYNILQIISVFNNPVPVRDISTFIDMNLDDLENIIQILVHKGILVKKIEDIGYVYEISNKILKNIIYKKISNAEKIQKHKIAATLFETEKNLNIITNIDELIFHLEKANNKEKARKYCIKNAKKMRALKNIQAQINYLEKALSIVNNNKPNEKIELLIQLGELFIETGAIKSAIEYLNIAKELSKVTKNHKALIDVYIHIVQVMDLLNKTDEITKCLDKVDKELENFKYTEARLESKRIRTLLMLDKNLLDESVQMCLEIIEECGDNYYKTKGNTYALLAYIYTLQSKTEEALLLYEQSMDLLKSIDYTWGILIVLNNIGTIYANYYQDLGKALSYFTKVRNLSEEYGLINSEVLALINIAVMHYIKYDYTIAYDHFKLALKKSAKTYSRDKNFFLYNVLTSVCADMNNYSEAYYYFNLSKKELEQYPNQGFDIMEFYNACINIYTAFGDFKKVEEYLRKSIDFVENGNSMDYFQNIISLNTITLRKKEVGTYHSNIEKIIDTCKKFVRYDLKVSSLSEAAIVLGEKNDFKNAKKLLSEAEKYMNKSIHNKVKAVYYYAKGIIEDDEPTEILLKALNFAKKVKSKWLISNINIKLGNYYFSQNNYCIAAKYYIEACEKLKKLIIQVPDEYKLKFVNSYNLAQPFYRIQYIKDIIINKYYNMFIRKEKDNFKIHSLEELSKLLDTYEINSFIENKEFMHIISTQYMQQGIMTERDILVNISGNTKQDIELIIKYLAALTLATRGLVIVKDQKQNLTVISSIDDNYNLPLNKQVFDKIKSTMEPLLISNRFIVNEYDTAFLPENINACLCIPIMSNNSKTKHNIIGYLYLESDRILNNFNYEKLQNCIELSKLLALLIEKHQLKQAASVDKLTGTLTRKYLENSLKATLDMANSHKYNFSIIMYDLDRFKRINDLFGHQIGDEVLKKVCKIVMDNIGIEGNVGRYGGEEFIIVLPGMGSEEALDIANKLREKIPEERILGDRVNITVSMGIASYPVHGQTINELVRKADQALYASKENGRNSCKVWNNKYANMLKSTNAIGGIITGNEVQDSRNILALVELIELINKNFTREEKFYNFLGRTIEIIEAQFGLLLLLDDENVIESFGRRTLENKWVENLSYNSNIVQNVIESKQGIYMVDWDDIEKQDLITGLPDWHSILVVPIIICDEVKGVIYLSTSTKTKEFDANDLNFVNVVSNLVGTVI